MNDFNNEMYQNLVTDLLGDAFYTETSYREKISIIRTYAEIVIRKLLNIDSSQKITLGKPEISRKIHALPNHEYIEEAIEIIREKGNKATHTQCLDTFTSNDFETVVDSLFDLFAFLLINYFEKYEFGSKNEVMFSFSLLPPVIRYKVLNFLYKKYPHNIFVIDKLVLVMMKFLGVKKTAAWIEEKKDSLIKIPSTINKPLGTVEYENLNMYEICTNKVSSVGSILQTNGPLYSDFESALPYYKKLGILKGTDTETKEFNDIMDFLYLGRKENFKKMPKSNQPYIVMIFDTSEEMPYNET